MSDTHHILVTDGGVDERERNKAHVKMLLNATMTDVCARYNPPLEKAFANLVSFRNHIETTVQQHGGWQPGILEALLENLDFEAVGQELGDEFTQQNLEELGETVEACLDKGIGQKAVFEALDEFVEKERRKIENQHGVTLE